MYAEIDVNKIREDNEDELRVGTVEKFLRMRIQRGSNNESDSEDEETAMAERWCVLEII